MKTLLVEATMMRANIEQRWITFSFVGGKIWRKFSEIAGEVLVPTLAIFGEQAEAIGEDPTQVEKADNFQKIRDDFKYFVVPQAGQSVHREKPQIVAERILQFANEQ